MLQLSKELKIQLFRLLKSQINPFGDTSDQLDIIPFLERIWNLRTMPSTDSRFQNAYDDAYQHLINNNDWDYDVTFLERFDLLESDEHFNKFLEAIVSPEVRQNEDEIIKFILLIEPFIAKDNFTFAVEDYTQNGPIYKLAENTDGLDFIVDIKTNLIPFLIEWNKTGRSTSLTSHQRPTHFPSFVLVFDDGWNDYGIKSLFNLFYYDDGGNVTSIGAIKIISDYEDRSITYVLNDSFTSLSFRFCSLGQSIDFYIKLKRAVGKDFESVLLALRDAAMFPDIHDKFEKNNDFKNSLIRYDAAEQALRTAKFISYGYDLQNLYTFNYTFRPLYAEEPVKIDFEFSKEGLVSNRIYALIGKNGTGKTQLITSLPLDISKKEDNLFIPRAPLFSKLIAVSYSVFDQFEVPRKSSTFNYVYCGLRKSNKEPYTDTGLMLRFYGSWKKIQTQGRLDSWKKVLSSFIDIDLMNNFIIDGNTEAGEQKFKIDNAKFQETKKKLSSGQSIVFYIITEIVANIRYDSLLLYDEPETHLHPNAISELIYIIYQLVDEFQSYCIIATHSPVIIRELFSRNVFVLDRDEAFLSIRSIGIESFGEDIGVLTEEVFGNKEVPKQYKKIIDNFVFLGYTFEQIVTQLESEKLPLSLNTRLYIRSAVKTDNA